jgi:hypothetical protein
MDIQELKLIVLQFMLAMACVHGLQIQKILHSIIMSFFGQENS